MNTFNRRNKSKFYQTNITCEHIMSRLFPTLITKYVHFKQSIHTSLFSSKAAIIFHSLKLYELSLFTYFTNTLFSPTIVTCQQTTYHVVSRVTRGRRENVCCVMQKYVKILQFTMEMHLKVPQWNWFDERYTFHT